MRDGVDYGPQRSTDMNLHFLIFFSFILLPDSVIAEPTNSGLGRLFLSPEERQTLDNQRMEALPHGRLDGVVKRSSGYNSVWIDQRLRTETDGMLPLAHTVGSPLPSVSRGR